MAVLRPSPPSHHHHHHRQEQQQQQQQQQQQELLPAAAPNSSSSMSPPQDGPAVEGAAAAAQGRAATTLKSRPHGMPPPDFGRQQHLRPGFLPPQLQAAAGSSASGVRCGTGLQRVRPRLHPASCCPPPGLEPMLAPRLDAADVIAARMADREAAAEAGLLLSRLVYDSLQPPESEPQPASSARADRFAYAEGLAPWLVPEEPWDTTLVFESRFESGNLRRAVQVSAFEYDLVLSPDLNTKAHTQWFFFAVSNARAGQRYRFNIINLAKPGSLYNAGMQPLLHSERCLHKEGVGWVRCGSDFAYGANGIRGCRRGARYCTLTFTLSFPHGGDDLVHLAHCYPFTASDQRCLLDALCREPAPSGIALQRSCLATSLAGSPVDLLTITAVPGHSSVPLHARQGVVLSARVHPGETQSSFIMAGALKQLLAEGPEADALRGRFVFRVVPMLNPDGVAAGNHRCSLAGVDLNRVYEAPCPRLQPVIAAFKQMVAAFCREREVVLACDMHGHSRRLSSFMYGACNEARIFPLLLAVNAPHLFSYRACSFKVHKSKAGTGRVVGFSELGITNSFTIEASFAGGSGSNGLLARQHFNAGHLEELGAAVVRTLLDYTAPPEHSSVPELRAQLDAGAGRAALVLPGMPGATSDDDEDEEEGAEDTDSDDDSSDEEAARARQAAAAAPSRAVGAWDAQQAGGSLSQQLVSLLSSVQQPDGPRPEAAAAGGVVASLLAALSSPGRSRRSRLMVAAAAQQLLDRLAVAQGKLKCSSSTSATPPAGPAAPPAALPAASKAAVRAASASECSSSSSLLASDEAALLALPGLAELLRQLVVQQQQQAAAAAGSSSPVAAKKGKRCVRNRWGSPEVLCAARAKADAGLAAALPELGFTPAGDGSSMPAGVLSLRPSAQR